MYNIVTHMYVSAVGNKRTFGSKLHFLNYSTGELGMIVELFSRRPFIKILFCHVTIWISRFRITTHFTGNFPEISQKFPGISRFCSGNFLEISRKFPGHFPETSRNFPGNFPDISRKFPGIFPEISRKFPGHFPEISWKFSGNFPDISRKFSGNFPENGVAVQD